MLSRCSFTAARPLFVTTPQVINGWRSCSSKQEEKTSKTAQEALLNAEKELKKTREQLTASQQECKELRKHVKFLKEAFMNLDF